MHKRTSQRGWLVIVVALAGCTSVPVPAPAPRTDVQYRAVNNADSKHYILSPAETAVAPTIGLANDPPIYPPALVARHLPSVSVRVTLIVDAKGRVTEVRFADAVQPDAVRQAFEQAVRDATLRWTFVPLLIQHWQDTPDGGAKVVQSDSKPFSQDYIFDFTVVNGKPVVNAGVPPSK